MDTQQALLLSYLTVIIFGFYASLLIQEGKEARKAKPFFVGYFISSLVTTIFFIEQSDIKNTFGQHVMDIMVIFNIAFLSVGLSIRFNKYRFEKYCYYLFIIYIGINLASINSFKISIIFTLIYIVISIFLILTRVHKPNKADYGLLITLLLWMIMMLLNLAHQPNDLVSNEANTGMINTLILLPAVTCGIAIFLVTSYMIDSNKQLNELASIDLQTNMLNRRALFEKAENQISYLKRTNKKASIILTDIDHFKSINDKYGHDAGDQAIQQFSNTIKKCIREYDIAARYGGEEFIIFLPDSDIQTAMKVANRIRTECESNNLLYQDKSISFTASFGVSDFHLYREFDFSIQLADKALYAAKHQGRNQVINI